MKFRFLAISLLFTAFSVAFCKPADLTPKETKKRAEEVLHAHVTHKVFTNELAARALKNFINELDPQKTYLIENEISKWINPTDDLLEQIVSDYKKEVFTEFEVIYNQAVEAIARRNHLETEIAAVDLTSILAHSDELKDLKWATSPTDLKDRLLKIKKLQNEAVQNFDTETKNQFFQKLAKYRLSQETEILGTSVKEKQQQMLSFVLKAFCTALDSQTCFFTPSEASQLLVQLQRRLFGIGALLKDDLNGFSIIRLIEGSPAIRCNKLKLGDKIIAANQEPLVGLDLIDAVERIRGPQGSTVTLTLLRTTNGETEKLEVDVVRDEIVLTENRFDTHIEPYGDGVIAQVRLYSFYADPNTSSTEDVKKAIIDIQANHKLKGVILDLRSNTGGLLTEAISMTGLFIKKGIVASVKESNGGLKHLRNFSGEPIWDGPLFVLTDRATASSAEIVAQTLQDYGRAVIIGDDRTYGKGTYQSLTLEDSAKQKVNPKGEFKVTRGLYYTVSGKTPQLNGVLSDITVPGWISKSEIGETFSEYPLQPDEISAHFIDDLDDIHPLHRGKFKRLYQNDLQLKEPLYINYLESLKKNSQARLENSKPYSRFLQKIANPESQEDYIVENDLQLEEAVNIMKDLLFLTKELNAPAA